LPTSKKLKPFCKATAYFSVLASASTAKTNTRRNLYKMLSLSLQVAPTQRLATGVLAPAAGQVAAGFEAVQIISVSSTRG